MWKCSRWIIISLNDSLYHFANLFLKQSFTWMFCKNRGQYANTWNTSLMAQINISCFFSQGHKKCSDSTWKENLYKSMLLKHHLSLRSHQLIVHMHNTWRERRIMCNTPPHHNPKHIDNMHSPFSPHLSLIFVSLLRCPGRARRWMLLGPNYVAR